MDRGATPARWAGWTPPATASGASPCARPASTAARVRLFAGCGIVADSDPEAELAESQAKFCPGPRLAHLRLAVGTRVLPQRQVLAVRRRRVLTPDRRAPANRFSCILHDAETGVGVDAPPRGSRGCASAPTGHGRSRSPRHLQPRRARGAAARRPPPRAGERVAGVEDPRGRPVDQVAASCGPAGAPGGSPRASRPTARTGTPTSKARPRADHRDRSTRSGRPPGSGRPPRRS